MDQHAINLVLNQVTKQYDALKDDVNRGFDRIDKNIDDLALDVIRREQLQDVKIEQLQKARWQLVGGVAVVMFVVEALRLWIEGGR